MSKVKSLFAQHGVEGAELIAGIEQLLTAAESNNTGVPISRLNEVIAERNNLRADKAEADATIEGLNSKLETAETELGVSGGYKAKLEAYETKEFGTMKSSWAETQKIFGIPETDKRFPKMEKIKSDFVIKENIDDYTKEEIAQNIAAYKPYEKMGYLAVDKGKPGEPDPRATGDKSTKPEDHPIFGVLHRK